MKNFQKNILNELRYKLNYLYYKIFAPKYMVSLGKKVRIHKETVFEGKNRVGSNTDVSLSKLGRCTYVGGRCCLVRCEVGRYTSISNSVELVKGQHPIREYMSTSPMFYSKQYGGGWTYVEDEYFEPYKYVDNEKRWSVKIGNDVWIGRGTKILEGVTIGDGAVVGAYTIVTKDLVPYGIYVGCPARLVGYRYDSEIIDLLLSYEWWNKDENWIKENAFLFRNKNMFIEYLKKQNLDENGK